MMADGDGSQCVINAEASRCRNLTGKSKNSLRIKANPQLPRLVCQLKVLCIQIILRLQAVTLHLAGASLQNPVRIGIVSVYNAESALAEQKTLAVQILFKALMLIRTDMVLRQIRKYTNVKHDSCRTVELQCLRRNLHDNCLYTVICHLPERLLQDNGLRGCIVCRMMIPVPRRLNGPDQAHVNSRAFQNGPYQVRSCCLSLRSGNADHLHSAGRMSVKG